MLVLHFLNWPNHINIIILEINQHLSDGLQTQNDKHIKSPSKRRDWKFISKEFLVHSSADFAQEIGKAKAQRLMDNSNHDSNWNNKDVECAYELIPMNNNKTTKYF